MAHEVKEIINGSYQPCTPTEFWGAYQTTMSTFMLEYHEHVSKGKANDFIAAQSDRAGEVPEKHVV
jgi:fluoride ion exporter CrcB/FEX